MKTIQTKIKNLEQRDGFINRNTEGLPEAGIIEVVMKDVDGEHIFLCKWEPFDSKNYTEVNMPGKGYLGTATVIEGRFSGIGFHAWEQNNSEFIYYKKC